MYFFDVYKYFGLQLSYIFWDILEVKSKKTKHQGIHL